MYRVWYKKEASKRMNEQTMHLFGSFFVVVEAARQHNEPKFEESHSSKDKLLGYNNSVKYNWLHLSNELGISHECEQSQSE